MMEHGGADGYEMLSKLGQGSYGSVFKARRHRDGAFVAIKVLDLNEVPENEHEAALNEVRIMAALRHENVVRYEHSFVEGHCLYIAMELCTLGDLRRALDERRGALLPETLVLSYLEQLLGGLAYLHSNRIIHRDLKTSNIFLASSSRGAVLRIGDLGVARLLSSRSKCARTLVGTPYYISPELLENKSYDSSSDVWALGCILYELLTLRHPFEAANQGALVLKILEGRYRPPSTVFSTGLRSLVGACLRHKPGRRPTAAQALQACKTIAAQGHGCRLPPPPTGADRRTTQARHVPLQQILPLSMAVGRKGRRPSSLPHQAPVQGNRVRRLGPAGAAHPATGRDIAASRQVLPSPPPGPIPLDGALDSRAGGALLPPSVEDLRALDAELNGEAFGLRREPSEQTLRATLPHWTADNTGVVDAALVQTRPCGPEGDAGLDHVGGAQPIDNLVEARVARQVVVQSAGMEGRGLAADGEVGEEGSSPRAESSDGDDTTFDDIPGFDPACDPVAADDRCTGSALGTTCPAGEPRDHGRPRQNLFGYSSDDDILSARRRESRALQRRCHALARSKSAPLNGLS